MKVLEDWILDLPIETMILAKYLYYNSIIRYNDPVAVFPPLLLLGRMIEPYV